MNCLLPLTVFVLSFLLVSADENSLSTQQNSLVQNTTTASNATEGGFIQEVNVAWNKLTNGVNSGITKIKEILSSERLNSTANSTEPALEVKQ